MCKNKATSKHLQCAKDLAKNQLKCVCHCCIKSSILFPLLPLKQQQHQQQQQIFSLLHKISLIFKLVISIVCFPRCLENNITNNNNNTNTLLSCYEKFRRSIKTSTFQTSTVQNSTFKPRLSNLDLSKLDSIIFSTTQISTISKSRPLKT